ncbi:MAG: PAS domain S-box protein [Pseudomonadota bacterium]|nr:PAS domain S-box protein [Pseudomonadota bacterium]
MTPLAPIPSPSVSVRADALDALSDAVLVTDLLGRVVHVNPSFTEVTGHARGDVLDNDAASFMGVGGLPDLDRADLCATLAAGRTWHGELWVTRRDGTTFLARCQWSGMSGDHRVGVFRDITEHRKRSSASFRTLIEGSPDGIAVHREDRFVYVNPSFLRCLGYKLSEDLVGSPLFEVIHAEDRAGVATMVAATEAQAVVEKRLLRADGSVVQAEVASLPVVFDGDSAFVLTVRDLTARRALETRMREMDRMVSIGTLASGIAHEINTPIQFIGDSAHFLHGAMTDLLGLLDDYRRLWQVAAVGGWAPELVAEILAKEEDVDAEYLAENCPKAVVRTLEGVSRVASIVRALKEFGHPGQAELAPADLNQAILNTVTVARNEWKYVAEVETVLATLPRVLCHLGSLNQVFLNLIVNAAHAIGDTVGNSGTKGKIRVRSSVEGPNVLITVEDSGSGIPEAVRPRIFDPFFTTKEVGRGTGQGLAIARSIVVEKHGGELSFETEIGVGTTFRILLPLGGQDADASGAP